MKRILLSIALVALSFFEFEAGGHAYAQGTSQPKMYWSETNGNIKRANLDGTSVETLLSGAGASPTDIAVDGEGGKIYWLSINDTKRIQRANLDGTSQETLANHSSEGDLSSMALDTVNGKIYWMSYSRDRIRRANLDGTSKETVLSGAFDSIDRHSRGWQRWENLL